MVVEPTERPASVHAVRRLVLLIGATLAATAVWVPTTWAGAIVANYADGILTVTGTAGDDTVTIRCEAATSP